MAHNMDEILTGQNRNVASMPDNVPEKISVPNEEASKPDEITEEPERLNHLDKFRRDKDEFLGQKNEDDAEILQNSDVEYETSEVKSQKSDDLDDYGNKIPKQRLYTEEELQQRIKDRLSRGRYAQEQQSQNINQDIKDFKSDPNSEESWEEQLANFVDRRVEAREKKVIEKQWKEQEDRVQSEFESRFTSGMQKYQDFNDVVYGKPITNSMLMAARSMKDPAAFVYTACKQHPKEVERISSILDPYQQAAEIGRLEERMRKSRTVSKAPKPVTRTRSDMSDKYVDEKLSIDQLIHSDAKRKLGRR